MWRKGKFQNIFKIKILKKKKLIISVDFFFTPDKLMRD